jgi:hypothetical protein
VVYKQTRNKTNKHIKKFQVQEQWNFSLSSSGVTPSASSPVLVFKQKLCHSHQVVRETHQLFFFLSFSSSCLVISSFSEMWLVLEFPISALWPTRHPALEFGILWVGLLGVCFFPCPLSLGQGQRSISQLPAVSMLCWFADSFLILQHYLTFDVDCWLRRWDLMTATCPISGSGLSLPAVCLSDFPVFISWKFPQRSAPYFFPLLWCAYSTLSPLLCVLCLLFRVFLWGNRSVCPGSYAGLSQGWLWEYHITLICSPFGLLDVSQADLEPASGGSGALLFFQCNMAWRSFVQAWGSGCQCFDSSWCFSAKCGSKVHKW